MPSSTRSRPGEHDRSDPHPRRRRRRDGRRLLAPPECLEVAFARLERLSALLAPPCRLAELTLGEHHSAIELVVVFVRG